MSFQLRPATLDDAAAIAHVQVTTWQDTYANIIDPDFLKAFTIEKATNIQVNRIQTDNAYRVVATIDEQVVGYAVANLNETETEPFKGDWFLFSLHVLPEHQGKGFGKALLNDAMREGKIRNFSRLVFGVFSENERSKQFYQHNGALFLEILPFQLDGKQYPTDYCQIMI
jgi:ribosomal protein S18 acetylase RimI-like enzyme